MDINIVFCFDCKKTNTYWKFLTTTIAQMLTKTNIDNFYNIHIITDYHITNKKLHCYISKYIKTNNWKINIIRPNFNFNKIDTSKWSISTLWRLLIPSLLKNINKVAYFDPDILFNKDPALLYKLPINKYAILGCEDMVVKHEIENKNALYDYIKNAKLQHRYINSGAMLMNLNKMRSINHNTIVKFLGNKKFWQLDQDYINFHMKIKNINASYNLINTINYIGYDKNHFQQNNVKYIHAYIKPWLFLNSDIKLESYITWVNYLYKSWTSIYKTIFKTKC